jgi:hypothetical protein
MATPELCVPAAEIASPAPVAGYAATPSQARRAERRVMT